MTTFRTMKHRLTVLLTPPAWPEGAETLPEAAAALHGMAVVSPLLSLLPRGGLLQWRAVVMLGRVVAALAASSPEDARTVMRRCMWHMNEDSGNMGWGVAEAMGEIAAQSPSIAGEYGKVILSYVRDTGFADNFIDHAELRRGAYWAVGRFAPAYPAYRDEAFELLTLGLDEADAPCRGAAAWGLGMLSLAGFFTDEKKRAVTQARLESLAEEKEPHGFCEILEGLHLCVEPAAVFARQALKRVVGSGS